MDYLPYSPDLAPTDIWLFSKLKSVLKGKCFLYTEGIKSWEPCKELEGDYFKKF
jgi:hypothetical protein